MSAKKTLFLAIILLACVLYIVRVEFPKREEAERKGFVFPKLEGVQLESIKIRKTKDASGAPVAVSLVNSSPKEQAAPTPTPAKDPSAFPPMDDGQDDLKLWMVEGVSGSRVEATVLKPIISALQTLKLDDPLPPDQVGDDLALFGLKEPALEVIAKRFGGNEKKLFVGAENEYLMKRYLTVEGDPQIYMVSPALFMAVDKPANDFRDRTPLDFDETTVASLKVSSSKGAVSLKQAGLGSWTVEEPVKLEASGEATATLLASIRGLRAEEFVDDGNSRLADYGLAAPSATIDIAFRDSSKSPPIKVVLGQKKDDATGVYFALSGFPTVYRSTSTPLSDFTKSVDELRSRQLFKFVVDRIKTAEFSGTAVWKMKIVNQGNSWKVNDKDGDTVFVDQIFYNLKDVPAEKFIKDSSKVSFENPRYEVTLKIDGPKAEETMVLTIGQQVPGVEPVQYYARVGADGEVFTVTEDSFKRIRPIEETLIRRPELEQASKPAP